MKTLCATLVVTLCCVTVLCAAERPQKTRIAAPPAPAVAAPGATALPAVLGIVPAQGEPGSRVSIFGSNFGAAATVVLGSVDLPAAVSEGRQLEFTIPPLDAGLYALYIKRSDGGTGRVYNFTVLPLRPQLNALVPERVSSCAQGDERTVIARGRNFTERSLLMYDGAVIGSRFVSPEEIAFSVPSGPGGQHQVSVRNEQADTGSLPRALTLESRPEISQIAVGSEHVNYYELNITGRNFHQNAAILVDGQRVGGRGGDAAGDRDKLIYVDCTRLVYQRHPYSPVNKDFRIMVVNPAGESSQAVQVSAP